MGLLAKHWRLLHRPVAMDSPAAWMRRYLTWLAADRPSVYDHHRNELANFLGWCEAIGVESAAAITRAKMMPGRAIWRRSRPSRSTGSSSAR